MFCLPSNGISALPASGRGRKAPGRAPRHAPSSTLGGSPTYPAIFNSWRDDSFFKKSRLEKNFPNPEASRQLYTIARGLSSLAGIKDKNHADLHPFEGTKIAARTGLQMS